MMRVFMAILCSLLAVYLLMALKSFMTDIEGISRDNPLL